jgi:hypothetical protein
MKLKTPKITKRAKQKPTNYTRPNWHDNFFREEEIYGIDRVEWREGLIRDMFDFYTDNPRALILEEWCYARRIPRITIYMWRDKYEDIRKGLKELLVFLGMKRQLGMFYGKIDRIAGKQSLYRYDEECDKDERRQAAITQATQEQGPANINYKPDHKKELRENGSDSQTDRTMDGTDSSQTV